MGRTEKEARAYARRMQALHPDGERWLVFKTPKGTAAHAQGLRFGTCRESEREAYTAGGAVFLD